MAIDLNVHNQQDPDQEEDNDLTHVEDHSNGVVSDNYDGFSDASSDVTELGSADFEAYFQERDERLFHSHGGLPYPLPVDTPEQERLNALHCILHTVLGAHFVGPVSQVLAPSPGRLQTRALDICTGTGTWVMDMASQFPNTKFRGFDIVPITTRHPLPNVQFEIHNVNEPVRWSDNTMDLIHARATDMVVSDYPAMLTEATRVLRHGGLFVSGEWERSPSFDNPAIEDTNRILGIRSLVDVVDLLLIERNASPPVTCIPDWLDASGQFQGITKQCYTVPIGDWPSDPAMKALGKNFRDVWVRYADSLKPMLREPSSGLGEAQINDLIAGYMHNMDNVPGMVGKYHTVHATKI